MKPEIICIVDDDPIVHFTVTKMIESTLSVKKILVFDDGEQIFDYLYKNAADKDALPDIILLDLNMPYMDGWEFLEEYAYLKPQLAKKITIYILSSSVSDFDIMNAMANRDVTDYIPKPLTKQKVEELFHN